MIQETTHTIYTVGISGAMKLSFSIKIYDVIIMFNSIMSSSTVQLVSVSFIFKNKGNGYIMTLIC